MHSIGIVGHEAAKFSGPARVRARWVIDMAIRSAQVLYGDTVVVSGGCHLGGVDAWAEEIAEALGVQAIVHKPQSHSWTTGYKPRNLLIARDSELVHVIVVTELPKEYIGMRFDLCYHCGTRSHVKSGACWTARQALALGKKTLWHEITQDGRARSYAGDLRIATQPDSGGGGDREKAGDERHGPSVEQRAGDEPRGDVRAPGGEASLDRNG